MRDGGEVVIERALEAGAQSLKTVALEAIGQTNATNVGANIAFITGDTPTGLCRRYDRVLFTDNRTLRHFRICRHGA